MHPVEVSVTHSLAFVDWDNVAARLQDLNEHSGVLRKAQLVLTLRVWLVIESVMKAV